MFLRYSYFENCCMYIYLFYFWIFQMSGFFLFVFLNFAFAIPIKLQSVVPKEIYLLFLAFPSFW